MCNITGWEITLTFDMETLDTIWRNIIFTLPIVDNINEFLIMQFLLQYQQQIEPLNQYPYVYAYECPLNPYESGAGKIDLVFTSQAGDFLITEVKYLSDTSGPTARVKRRKSRRKVEEQAGHYEFVYKHLYPDKTVASCYFTNDDFGWSGKLTHLRDEYTSYRQEQLETIATIYPKLF